MVRRTNMRIFVAMLALAFAAGSASASQLDFQPSAPGAGGPQFKDMGAQKSLLEANGPIRHRRPYRDRDYGYSEPVYFATRGAGRFDPTDQPGQGLYVNGSVGSVLADQLDLGIQLSWYHRSTGGEEFVRQGDLPDGTHVTTVVRTRSIDTNLNVARQTSLYGEAVWNASTPKAEFFDPAIGQTVREEADFDGVAFHGGLRFTF